MKKYISLVFILLFSVFVIPSKSYALNLKPYMIITNPGECASAEMNVSWHMDIGVENGKLIYTTKDDVSWTNAQTIIGKYNIVTTFSPITFLKYEVELKDLLDDTEYMYKVGGDVLSDIYYFKTAGAEEFSFVWIGDWHSYLSIPSRVTSATNMINKALEVEPSTDFLLSTGDMVANGGDYQAWQDLYTKNQYKNFMWSTAVGNHDALGANGNSDSEEYFAAVHNYPDNGYSDQLGKSYYFKYGNSLFIFLNSVSLSSSIAIAQSWLINVIKNNPADFVFVAMHYNWFSGITGENYQYNNWKYFFEQNNVDLAMSGHNHIYLRTHRLYNDLPDSNKGTVYMQSPSSDNGRGRDMNPSIVNADKIITRWSEGANTIGAIIVNVDSNSIKTSLIDRNGTIIDEAIIIEKSEEKVFSKEEFLSSITYTPSQLSQTSAVISASPKGIGFINRIEYYNNGSLLGVNHFYKITNSSYTIPNVAHLESIDVKVIFTDGEIKNLKLKVLNNDYLKISNLKLIKEDNKFKLLWDYNGLSSLKAWVFINEEAYKEINLKDNAVFLKDIDLNSVISIRPSQDSLVKRYSTIYNTYGDGNLDGKIDLEDLKIIQAFLLGKNTDLDCKFLDIDLDEHLTIYDLTYIHLYINQLVKNLNKEKYNLIFLDHYGKIISITNVGTMDEIIPPKFKLPTGYVFIAWDQDYSNISSNTTFVPIYEYGN